MFVTQKPFFFFRQKSLCGALLVSMCAILVSCSRPVYYEETGSVFNTYYRIKYSCDRMLTAEIDAELQAFNLSLNPFNPNSILAKVNRNEDVEVDDWFATVFNKAKDVSAHSGGYFDATAAPLINVWGFGFERKDSVSQQVIDSLRVFVGYDGIRLDHRRVVKDDQRTMLNFSAIAKGYACDVIAMMLERQGVENYLIDIGGEIAAKGVNPNGDCWRVGITTPEEGIGMTDNDLSGIVRLCGKQCLATSGNYRNYYVKDGKKYAHTINPLTGYPSEQDILSATIVAPDCITADAYATAFMAMGSEKAIRMAAEIPDIEYFIICDKGDGSFDMRYSDGMKSKLLR